MWPACDTPSPLPFWERSCFSPQSCLSFQTRECMGARLVEQIFGDFSVSNCGENILTIIDDTKKSWRNGSSFKGDLKRNSQGKFKSDHDFWYFDNFGRKLFVIRAAYILFPFSHKTTRLWWVAANIFETKSLFWLFQEVFHAPKLHFYAKR